MSTGAQSPTTGQATPSELTPDFQLKLLALTTRDARFACTVGTLLRGAQFATLYNGAYLQAVADWVAHWAKTYSSQHPTLPRYVFEQWSVSWTEAQPRDQRDYHAVAWRRVAWEIYESELPAPGYVRDASIAWIQKREEMALAAEWKRAIDKGQGIAEFGLMARAREIDALPRRVQGLGLTMGFDLDAEHVLEQEELPRFPLPTGYRRMDEIMSGGPGRKELLVIAAPPNVGKTTTCCALSARWVLRGAFGIYYTLEQAAPQIRDKHLSTLSGSLPAVLREHPQVRRAWKEYMHRAGGRLLIQEYPTGGASIDDIHAHLAAVRASFGKGPDFIVVDYADLMRGTSGEKYDQLRHKLSAIYVMLRGLAMEYNCLVVTPTQTNRQSVSKELITIDDLAECFDKAAIADIIIALCQTDDEVQRNVARAFFAKNRHGPKFGTIPFMIYPALAKLEEEERHNLGPDNRANYGTLLAQASSFQQQVFAQQFNTRYAQGAPQA